ncbi:MAG TPA: tetratricopeptide repeat protein, partial [Holophagaceae bacterium]|nr:tetratricopeptide repeat protein [Holophagaceae bacterium]
LLSQGKFNEAAAKFQEAMKADPASSFPVSALSKLFYEASKATDPAHEAEYLGKAQDLARQALDKNDLDFIASEVLLNADGGSTESRHQPKAEAVEPFNQAETAYRARKWDEAIAGYQKALAADPAFTDAALYLGDVYFDRKQYDKAEPWFRKSTQLEPRYARAWRFLADCQAQQGHWADALATDLSAIAAQPDDYTAWGRLRQIYEAQDKLALVRFHWPAVRESRIEKDKAGQLQMTFSGLSVDESAEGAALAAYELVSGLSQMPDDHDVKPSDLTWRAEAWEAALERYEDALKEKKATPKDATWAQLLAFYKAGELKPALLILLYREVYRPDFEAWKTAHPDGVRAFIERWHLRP